MKKIMLFAAIATVMAGCSNDEDFAPQQKNVLPEDGVIRLEAGVNDIRSRAIGYGTDELTEFGLFVDNATNDTYSYSNVCMKKDNSGWASYRSDGTTPWQMLWQSESTSVIVTAYAPYDKNVVSSGPDFTGAVETEQTIEANSKKSDLLYAKASVKPAEPCTTNAIYYDTDAKKLNVKMNHVMSKLTVNIRYGTELTLGSATPSLTAVKLGNTKTGYSLNLVNVNVQVSGEQSDINMMLSNAAAASYSNSAEAILVPQEAAFTITVTIGGRTFVYNNTTDFKFESGNAYTLNLLVGKDIVNIGNITASEWTSNDGGKLETE